MLRMVGDPCPSKGGDIFFENARGPSPTSGGDMLRMVGDPCPSKARRHFLRKW